MKLEERYKDVTFETLNREDFLDSVKDAFPDVGLGEGVQRVQGCGAE